ncbi:MAG TPA: TonB-dependent receptor, partial [Flavobacteriaceae bacterium]|nr:TonB-dependent receptor [Flavobacteriaceae bacterium]
PLTVGYTYTDTEFLNSFGSDDGIWGTVSEGDEIPYIAKHQLNASIGLEHKKYSINLNGRYNGAFRTVSGKGSIPNNQKVESAIVLDLAGRYHISSKLSATANIINLLDNEYAVSRVPAGLRPGHPFGIYAGLEFQF